MEEGRPPFTPIAGIDFFEVRRSFDNGLAFDTLGFEQEPIWHINFINNDSVKIFSPDSNAMLHYSIYFDQDSIFHFGREWFRVKSLEKDSLLLQRLTVVSKTVKEARSNVYMKLYSESYIRDSLKTSVEELRQPRANDTAFIRWRSTIANANPTVIDSAFAARRPVQLIPKNPNVTVKTRSFSEAERLNQSAAYDYLYPEYDIVIKKAYKNFYYPFSVLVDGKGDVHLGKFVASEDFVESRKRVLEGIIDVYLKHLFTIKPGTTLGIPHTSLIMLRVRGIE
ncbi:hypothetical protein GCM10023231_22730 [Olivibacter ginsenosidimutans]|uniref:DUF3822 family protein n=1 Tax=Olivibacter ginsenosidimutans TaxID=1176537 RepID=A0ABP9BGJ0_9SPHI